MKEHHATKGGEKHKWHIFCGLCAYKCMRVFFLIALVVWQQCLIPVSIVYAVEDVAVNDEVKETVSEEEKQDEGKNVDEEVVDEEKDGAADETQNNDNDNKDDEVDADEDCGDEMSEGTVGDASRQEDADVGKNDEIVADDSDKTMAVIPSESGSELIAEDEAEKGILPCFDENGNEIVLGDELYESICLEKNDGDERSQKTHEEENDHKKTEECTDECASVETVNDNDANVETQVSVISDTENNTIIGGDAEDVQGSHDEDDRANAHDGVENYVVDSMENMELFLLHDDTNVIDTGDATSIADIFRDINHNVIGVNWQRTVYDLRGVYDDNINLFDQFTALLTRAEDLPIGHADIYNENHADVSADVLVTAQTGDNVIDGVEDAAVITTGEARAGANIVNVINQNIVGNNWFFAMINVFGQWTGDLIVPGEGLLHMTESTLAQRVEVMNINDATASEQITVTANTGENVIDDSGQSVINTGDAIAATQVTDIVNTNIINNNWFFLMINNMGTWTGNVLRWDDDVLGYQSVFRYDFGDEKNESEEENFCESCDVLRVHNENHAIVDTNVVAQASTGNNTINGSVQGTINTGDAHAWTNVVNFINTNIVGNNWFFGVVNVMNEWTGDVVFAYPDIAVTISDAREQAFVGDALSYVVTYENIGEATAESVVMSIALPDHMTYTINDDEKISLQSTHDLVVNLSAIAPGESGSFVIEAMIDGADDTQKNMSAMAYASIKTDTAEVDTDNNHASDSTIITYASNESGTQIPSTQDMGVVDGELAFEIDPEIEVRRVSNVTGAVRAGDIVSQRIMVKNVGDSPVYEVMITENMKNASGEGMVAYEWSAGVLAEGETAIIDYAVAISPGLQPNDYQFTASAEGRDILDDKVHSNAESMQMAVAASMPLAYTQQELDPVDDSGEFIPQAQAFGGDKISADHGWNDRWYWVLFTTLVVFVVSMNRFLIRRQRRE